MVEEVVKAETLLKNYMAFCFRKGSEMELDSINSLARAVAIWGRVRVGD